MANPNRANNKFVQSPEVVEKQAKAAKMRAEGYFWHEIATELGYASPSGASEAVRAFYASVPRETIQDIRDNFMTKLEGLERMAREVMARKHYVVASVPNYGPVLVKDEHGEYLIDSGPIFQGLELIRKQMETALKFLPGVAAVTKVQVITDDDLDAALAAERAALIELESQGDSGSG
jgi:hypothetical protein